MRRIFLFLVLLALALPVMATNWDDDDCDDECGGYGGDTTITSHGGKGGRGGDGGNAEALGVGIGLGLGVGGGADVDVRNRNRNDNWLWTDVNNKVRNEQNQGQFQGQHQGQQQGNFGANVGLGSGNKTRTKQIVNVEGDKYEAPKKPDVPAYAPSVNPATATAPCYATWSVNGGWAGLFAAGGGGYKKDHGCALGEVVRRATEAGQPEVAEKALNLMLQVVMDEAGIEDDAAEDDTVAEQEYISGGRDEAFAFQRSYGD